MTLAFRKVGPLELGVLLVESVIPMMPIIIPAVNAKWKSLRFCMRKLSGLSYALDVVRSDRLPYVPSVEHVTRREEDNVPVKDKSIRSKK